MTRHAATIWDRELNFLKRASDRATAVFSSLDPELNPRLLLVGLPCSGPGSAAVVCEGDAYSPADFAGVLAGCRRDGSRDDALRPAALDVDQIFVRDQLEYVLHQGDEAHGKVSFSSLPSRVSQHWVCVVLQLDSVAFSQWPSLKKKMVDDERVRTSLVDAAAATYLRTCQLALLRPTHADALLDPAEHILRNAAQELMWTPAWAAAREPADLFGACNALASLTYERGEATGSMIVAAADHANIERSVQFENPVPANHFRRVRKLLELARDGVSLLTDSLSVLGVGRVRPEYDPGTEEVFSIAFAGRNTWELRHGETTLMRVVNGQPRKPLGLGDVERRLRALFPDLSDASVRQLRKLIEDLRQERGTTLVISAQVAQESERLKNQCTRINPRQIDSALMRRLTSIDGAVLVDTQGVCYAIGAILDGRAARESDPARGSRYNSALGYVESCGHPAMAVVVSEDGTVDLLPPKL